MSQIWWLHLSYDEIQDEFFAYVDDSEQMGSIGSTSIYQIDDTKEICGYIETGVMNHIDDVNGLRDFLIAQEFIDKHDIIKLDRELMW